MATDTVEAIVAPLSAELELEAALHKHQRTSERLARFAREAERLESRLREAERDASELRAAVAKTYAMIPGLPIEAETMDAATDALHDLCLTVGLFDIPVDGVDRAMEGEDA